MELDRYDTGCCARDVFEAFTVALVDSLAGVRLEKFT